MSMTRSQAWDLLTKYNKEPFHLRHAITVEHVMGWYARQMGYEDQADMWSVVGLLHDLDFEEPIIRAAASHGWGLRVEIEPEHEMEKVLYASDELTGLIGAAALMRPSKSTADMELKSLKKKFKDKKFAAGCSRDVIANGAELLGWELDKLLDMTLKAMQAEEGAIEAAVAALE